MSQIIFATINSFVGLPPVKQLLIHFQDRFNISSVQCVLDDHDDFFQESGADQTVIYRYKSIAGYKRQSISQKTLRYLTLSKFLFKKMLRSKGDKAIIFVTDLYTLVMCILLKREHHKIVYLQYEIIEKEYLNRLDRFLFNIVKRSYKKVDLFVTPESNRTDLLKKVLHQVSSDLFFTLPNTNNNKVELTEKKVTNRTIVTHIGAVGLSHHIKSFLDAVSQLDAQLYEVRFIGNLTNEVIELINSYDCGSIKIIGQLKHSELKQYYLDTDVGVILYKDVSLNHRFCAPNKLYEYWSHGIPVIGDKLPGLTSVFNEPFLGKLIAMEKPEEIMYALEELKNQKGNKQIILDYFNSQLKLDCYLDALDQKLSI